MYGHHFTAANMAAQQEYTQSIVQIRSDVANYTPTDESAEEYRVAFEGLVDLFKDRDGLGQVTAERAAAITIAMKDRSMEEPPPWGDRESEIARHALGDERQKDKCDLDILKINNVFAPSEVSEVLSKAGTRLKDAYYGWNYVPLKGMGDTFEYKRNFESLTDKLDVYGTDKERAKKLAAVLIGRQIAEHSALGYEPIGQQAAVETLLSSIEENGVMSVVPEDTSIVALNKQGDRLAYLPEGRSANQFRPKIFEADSYVKSFIAVQQRFLEVGFSDDDSVSLASGQIEKAAQGLRITDGLSRQYLVDTALASQVTAPTNDVVRSLDVK